MPINITYREAQEMHDKLIEESRINLTKNDIYGDTKHYISVAEHYTIVEQGDRDMDFLEKQRDVALEDFLSAGDNNTFREIDDSDPKPNQVRRSILAAMHFLGITIPTNSRQSK